MKKILIIAFLALLMPAVLAQAELSVEISEVSGKVMVLISGETSWKNAKDGMFLHSGDSLKTYDNSSAEIAFNAGKKNIVKIQPNTYVVLKLEKNRKLELIDGEVFCLIRNLPAGSAFEVHTPIAVCGARGTVYKVESKRERSVTRVTVARKTVRLESRKEPFKVVTIETYERREIWTWEEAILRGKGTGLPREKIKALRGKAREITEAEYVKAFGADAMVSAKRAASVDAYRKLAEKIYGVVIDSETTLEDFAREDNIIRRTVQGIVEGAKEARVAYYSDGSVEVTMETRGALVRDELIPVTGDIYGIDCIPGPDTLKKEDLKDFPI